MKICSTERHEKIKSTWNDFVCFTDRRKDWPGEPLIIANCSACGDTLAVPTKMREEALRQSLSIANIMAGGSL